VSTQQQKNNNLSVKGYQLYYQNATPYLDRDNDAYAHDSYWVVKLFDVTFKLYENDINNSYVAVPTLFTQSVTRHPYQYGDINTEYFVSYRTGASTVKQSPITGAGSPLRKKEKDLDAQPFSIDDDIFASKLKQNAESSGYTFLPADIYVLQALFKLAQDKGLFPTDRTGGIVPHYDVVPKPFNKLVKNISDKEQLIIQGLQPRVMDQLGEGLLPGEEYWRYQMKLKEMEFFIRQQKLDAEHRMQELQASMTEIPSMTVDNAETFVVDDNNKDDWPINSKRKLR
jgi:hypothetical protein